MPEMTAIFSDVAKFTHWLDVEILATEAWANPRNARRADDIRREARAFLPPCRPRSHPPRSRPRGDRRWKALGGRRHLLEHRPRDRESGLRCTGAEASARHPSARSRPS